MKQLSAGRQHDTSDSHAEERRERQAVMSSEEWNGHEAAEPSARDGAERIAGIGGADASADPLGAVRHDLADQRKGRTHAESRGQDHDERLQEGEAERSAPIGVAESFPPAVETIEQPPEDDDGQEPIDPDAHL